MKKYTADSVAVITLVSAPEERLLARRMIASLRAFGGELAHSPVWLFAVETELAACRAFAGEGVTVIRLHVPESMRGYLFSDKAAACAAGESLTRGRASTLIYLTAESLVLQSPRLLCLNGEAGAALRPVHIRNVGSPAQDPPDAFWRGVFAAAGVDEVALTVNSFVEDQPLRAYFNSGAFSVDPGLGLMQAWLSCFETLVLDGDFQARACADSLHRIFLHQAILSCLFASRIEPERLRMLPPTYGYPYHLQMKIPPERRAATLEELVCVIDDEGSLNPKTATDICIHPELRIWLEEHSQAGFPVTG